MSITRVKTTVLFQITIVLLFSLLTIKYVVNAAPITKKTTDNLVTITPFLQTVSLPASDPDKSFQVSVTNNSNNTQKFTFSALDFGSLDETGGLIFAGSNQTALIKKYGLVKWLTLSDSELSIEPHVTAQITARIINDDSLSPGGHYAAIVASVINGNQSISNSVTLNQKLTSLILATKTGGEKYDLRLETLAYSSSLNHLPQTARLVFKNNGNVHTVPRGVIELKNSSGRTVAKGIINEASSYVLPESKREMYVPLHRLNSGRNWPGTYRLQATYHYDGYDTYATRSITLRYIPWITVVLVPLVIAFIWGAYMAYTKSFVGRKISRKIKRYFK